MDGVKKELETTERPADAGQNTGVSSCSFLQGIFPTHLHEVKLIETESGMRAAGIGGRGTGNEI